jgi:hypothetical protein
MKNRLNKEPEYKLLKHDCKKILAGLPEITRCIIIKSSASIARKLYDRSYLDARKQYFYEEVLGEAVIASRG